MRISDWSSDVCSSDLNRHRAIGAKPGRRAAFGTSEMTLSAGDTIIFMLGRPIAQAKSPALMNAWFERQGVACAMVPLLLPEIGRASWRERVGQYVLIQWVAVHLKKKNKHNKHI